MFTNSPHISIRPARPEDAPALWRLAALDSRRPPKGPALVAEEDGELVAALAVAGGGAIADPFRLTSGAVAMLELRATQLRAAPPHAAALADRGRLSPVPAA